MAEKLVGLRVFSDDEGKMNKSLLDIGGEAIVVSQFTLYGDVKKGKRPGFDGAAHPEIGDRLYQQVVARMRELGVPTGTGVFAHTLKWNCTTTVGDHIDHRVRRSLAAGFSGSTTLHPADSAALSPVQHLTLPGEFKWKSEHSQ